ncbi:cupin domain-containing protein [bacterium]|nr:cupin domain-containing protein [bacterium]
MYIPQKDIKPLEFDGLTIFDYTAGRESGSSIAEITVPAGVRHKISWSMRSDKYYYVIQGTVDFMIGGEERRLAAGDVCIVPQGIRFNYVNHGPGVAKLILVHTPDFRLECEVFE